MQPQVKFYERDNQPVNDGETYAVAFDGCFGIGDSLIERDGHPLQARFYVEFPEAGGPLGASIIFPDALDAQEAAAFEEYFGAHFDEARRRIDLSGEAFLAYNASSLWNDYEKVLIAEGVDPAELDAEEDDEFLF